MTLKDLLLKYEFDSLVPDLVLTDKPVKDNLYAFKEAFDVLRRMEPGDPHGEEIVVDMEVDTDDDGNEIERYLYASNCEGDFWEASLAKEIIIKADVTEERALAQILWHMTFYGFSAEEKTMWDDVPHNRYERKAALLEYRQHCNYARIKCKNRPSEDDLRCALSLDEWKIYEKREAHRNRAKRMRDARHRFTTTLSTAKMAAGASTSAGVIKIPGRPNWSIAMRNGNFNGATRRKRTSSKRKHILQVSSQDSIQMRSILL